MTIKRRIFRQGNSLVISIPIWMIEGIGLKKGDYIAMTLEGKKRIVISRVTVIGRERAKGGNNDGG